VEISRVENRTWNETLAAFMDMAGVNSKRKENCCRRGGERNSQALPAFSAFSSLPSVWRQSQALLQSGLFSTFCRLSGCCLWTDDAGVDLGHRRREMWRVVTGCGRRGQTTATTDGEQRQRNEHRVKISMLAKIMAGRCFLRKAAGRQASARWVIDRAAMAGM